MKVNHFITHYTGLQGYQTVVPYVIIFADKLYWLPKLTVYQRCYMMDRLVICTKNSCQVENQSLYQIFRILNQFSVISVVCVLTSGKWGRNCDRVVKM